MGVEHIAQRYKIAEMNYLLENKASRLGVQFHLIRCLEQVDADKLSASAKKLWDLPWSQ